MARANLQGRSSSWNTDPGARCLLCFLNRTGSRKKPGRFPKPLKVSRSPRSPNNADGRGDVASLRAGNAKHKLCLRSRGLPGSHQFPPTGLRVSGLSECKWRTTDSMPSASIQPSARRAEVWHLARNRHQTARETAADSPQLGITLYHETQHRAAPGVGWTCR